MENVTEATPEVPTARPGGCPAKGQCYHRCAVEFVLSATDAAPAVQPLALAA
jgi:hypothetical protein